MKNLPIEMAQQIWANQRTEIPEDRLVYDPRFDEPMQGREETNFWMPLGLAVIVTLACMAIAKLNGVW
ncbi:MAG: hypothetical protein ACREIC_06465 [Limisphaerales bacterium]